jgi:ferric-dicitrate binding protein FerR (iron transport regulator)
VHAHEGRVWITEEAASADVVLGAGESFRLARRGLAVVEALSDASISIQFQL